MTASIELPAREVPVHGDYDVIVCGAGPAGLGAALAAGRAGARTLLVERLAMVGGLGTQTRVNNWCDTPGGRLFDELEARMAALGQADRHFNPAAHTWEHGRCRLHGETLKAVAVEMLAEAGVEVFYQATVCDMLRDGTAVTGVVLATKGGLRAALAKVVIDCTADAEVAHLAGAATEQGDPVDGRLMHVHFMFSLTGVDQATARAEALPTAELIARIQAAHADGRLRAPRGVFRPAPELFPYHAAEETLVLSGWEIDGVDASDPGQVSETLVECQQIALMVLRFARAALPGHAEAQIARFWDVLGTRESRRIVGRARVTRDDLLAGRKFPDGITRACFFIDFHDSPPGRSIPYTLEFKQQHTPPPGDFYEIPYGCLLPRDVDRLLVAGRCISCDRDVLASMRVMPSCMFTGEAAGTAAAWAVAQGVAPHELDGAALKARLIEP